MGGRLSRAILWLFVLDLGIAFGAGLYESRIAFSSWLLAAPDGLHWNAEAARGADTGRRFWIFVTTAPLTVLTVASLFAARRAVGPVRPWWLAAGIVALAERAFTFSYFIPTMIGLMEAPDSPESVATALRWASLNHLRHVLLVAAWLASLRALSLLYLTREQGL
jgi:hypothetical protein